MMAEDNVSSLMLEQFRRLNARLDRSDLEQLEIKLRLSAIEELMGGLVSSNGAMNHRLDRIDERVSRIERRLDLVDTK